MKMYVFKIFILFLSIGCQSSFAAIPASEKAALTAIYKHLGLELPGTGFTKCHTINVRCNEDKM